MSALDFLQTLYTPLVSDTMDKLGITGQILDHSIQSIFLDPHLKVAGYAFPCRVIPTEEYVEINTLLEMVDAIPKDSVVLVAADGDTDAALWGGLMSTRAKIRGARAAVVNGGVRDIEQVANLNFPVFGTYRCIKDIRRRGFMAEYNTTVTIGGVTVEPGDIIFGDANGVLSIPAKSEKIIIEKLMEVSQNEMLTMKELEQGSGAIKVFKTYKTF
ncbi:MAG TPA: RraA family protein [Candidatus Kapabacteria bacterium]|nr:RraA family protein [Candidatus Kapabacteria bacterium]